MDQDIKMILEDHEKRIRALENRIEVTNIAETGKSVSIKEFILAKKPKNDVLKTLTIGYFLEKYEGFTCFNVQDIRNAFKNAKEPLPHNLNLCVIWNIKKGHMMESKEGKDKRKAWVLTASGERFLENGFKKE